MIIRLINFVMAMALKLNQNIYKGGWDGDGDYKYYLKRLAEELTEVKKAIKLGLSAHDVRSECADVANFAMMVADSYEFSKDMDEAFTPICESYGAQAQPEHFKKQEEKR